LQQFLPLIREKFKLHSVGAFTYSDNLPSIRVLEKCGFQMLEEFIENGIASKYFEHN
jgi:RimJ/RimL family protein N-acetyltransferase